MIKQIVKVMQVGDVYVDPAIILLVKPASEGGSRVMIQIGDQGTYHYLHTQEDPVELASRWTACFVVGAGSGDWTSIR